MNNLRNNVQLIGHLGTDPEVKNFENGKMKASFSLATNDVYKKEGAYETDTQWHNVVAWNNTAKIAEKILKKPVVVMIVIGNKNLGLGHVYRTLTLAHSMRVRPIFLISEKEKLGRSKISESFFPFKIYRNHK